MHISETNCFEQNKFNIFSPLLELFFVKTYSYAASDVGTKQWTSRYTYSHGNPEVSVVTDAADEVESVYRAGVKRCIDCILEPKHEHTNNSSIMTCRGRGTELVAVKNNSVPIALICRCRRVPRMAHGGEERKNRRKAVMWVKRKWKWSGLIRARRCVT